MTARSTGSSRRIQYDPHVDIDWDAPWQFDKYAMAPKSVSLYGTRRWSALTPDEQRTLTLHEAVSVWSTVAYLSAILTGNQLRRAQEEGLNTSVAREALLEVGGGSRTTLTFGRLVRASGVPPYKPPRGTATAVKLLHFLPLGAASHATKLLVEETFTRGFADVVEDPDIEPHVRQSVKLHGLDWSERVRSAQAEVLAAQRSAGWISAAYNRALLAVLANVILRITVSPAVYRSIGMSPVRGVIASRRMRRRRRAELAAPLVHFLGSAHMLDGVLTTRLWKLTGVLPPALHSTGELIDDGSSHRRTRRRNRFFRPRHGHTTPA
ncbi:MAG: diiron oxygenase [Rhodococcus sp. (in: high G+C Gram-positive bacteria)]